MADISSNLLYYYKFDRGDLSGTTLKNWATNAYDGIVSSRSVISNKNYYIGNSSMECANGGMNVPLTLGAAGFSFSFWLSATHVQNSFYFNSSFINFNHYNNVLHLFSFKTPILNEYFINNSSLFFVYCFSWIHIFLVFHMFL